MKYNLWKKEVVNTETKEEGWVYFGTIDTSIDKDELEIILKSEIQITEGHKNGNSNL